MSIENMKPYDSSHGMGGLVPPVITYFVLAPTYRDFLIWRQTQPRYMKTICIIAYEQLQGMLLGKHHQLIKLPGWERGKDAHFRMAVHNIEFLREQELKHAPES